MIRRKTSRKNRRNSEIQQLFYKNFPNNFQLAETTAVQRFFHKFTLFNLINLMFIDHANAIVQNRFGISFTFRYYFVKNIANFLFFIS